MLTIPPGPAAPTLNDPANFNAAALAFFSWMAENWGGSPGHSVFTADEGGNLPLDGRLIGGIGAKSTAGNVDWNDVTNARSGSGEVLLLGSDPNGPGPGVYFHSFCFEYNSKDGSGNLTQWAVGYNTTRMFQRYRFNGTWSGWKEMAADYDEGAWTPTVSHGSVSVSEAKYVKTGNMVTVTARMFAFTDLSSTSQIVISGLPFVMQNLGFGPAMFRNVSGAENGIAIYGSPGNSNFQVLANGAANAWTSVDYNDLNSSSSEIRFTVSYFTF